MSGCYEWEVKQNIIKFINDNITTFKVEDYFPDFYNDNDTIKISEV